MEIIVLGFIIFVIVVAIVAWFTGGKEGQEDLMWEESSSEDSFYHKKYKVSSYLTQFSYGRKRAVMTDRELKFFRRLENISQDKYYIFPQMHLSALMFNKTSGRYRRLAFQRINRTSVDFVLCDKDTLTPVYAVELDDHTHDTDLRRKRDAGVEAMLEGVSIPLVRFRDVERMRDDQIIDKFVEASENN